MLESLFKAGANICRINAAHADQAAIVRSIEKIKEVNARMGTFVSTLVDIKGPEIRTGDLFMPENGELVEKEKVNLEVGQQLYMLLKPNADLPQDDLQVCVNYGGMIEDAEIGQTLLLDNGLLSLKVVEVAKDYLKAEVAIGGPLGQRRHVNLPGVYVRLPSITEKDKVDTKVAVEAGVDFIALSFVRSAQDVLNLRAYLRDIQSDAKIIAKIEDESGVKHLEEIIKASDGIMVARGDLGVETPIEYIPIEQGRMAKLCHQYGKPVVIATHMLESMIHSPIPTRAEVTDIAHAVGVNRADAIMLSGETGVGSYPVECVNMMTTVALAQEKMMTTGSSSELRLNGTKEQLIRSAVDLADSLDGASIVVFTRDGFSAKILATLRPAQSRIFACTDREEVAREMSLYWGVEPILLALGQHQMSEEYAVNEAVVQLQTRNLVSIGEDLVVLAKTSVKSNIPGDMVDSLQVRKVK